MAVCGADELLNVHKKCALDGKLEQLSLGTGMVNAATIGSELGAN
jgi:hypothetical protein